MSAFSCSHRVAYSDCTLGNHVYYARYLYFLEAARGEFLRHLGTTFLEWQEQDTIFPVMECHLRYLLPARYDDVLTIEVRANVAGAAKLNFACRILNQGGALVLEGETLHVCTTVNGKPKRLPEKLRAVLNSLDQAG